MENLCLKGSLGMYTVLPQVLYGGIIRVLQTQFSSSFQNNPKNLDLSHKTDLDLWDCLGEVKNIQQNFIGLI